MPAPRYLRFQFVCLLVGFLYGCASHPPERLYANEDHLLGNISNPKADSWYLNDNSEGWFAEYDAAKDEDATAAEIAAYQSMGMALSEALCYKQLDDIQRRQNKLGFSQGEFNLLVILGTGILGVNEASPENLTRTALGAAAINSTMDLYRNHYLLGPDGDVIVEMVKDGMARLRQEVENSPSPQTFVGAYRQLQAFSNTCTSSSIRKLVRGAIKSANIVVGDTLQNTASAVHKDNIADSLNRNGLSYDQMAAVYWYAMEQPDNKYDDYLVKTLNGISLKDIKNAKATIRSSFRSMPKLMATYSAWVKEQSKAVDDALDKQNLADAAEKAEVVKTIVPPQYIPQAGVKFLEVD